VTTATGTPCSALRSTKLDETLAAGALAGKTDVSLVA